MHSAQIFLQAAGPCSEWRVTDAHMAQFHSSQERGCSSLPMCQRALHPYTLAFPSPGGSCSLCLSPTSPLTHMALNLQSGRLGSSGGLHSLWCQTYLLSSLSLPLPCCASWAMCVHLRAPICEARIINSYPTGQSWESNRIVNGKCLAQCLAHSRGSVIIAVFIPASR
jgi:hypothetical protein